MSAVRIQFYELVIGRRKFRAKTWKFVPEGGRVKGEGSPNEVSPDAVPLS